MVCVSTIFYLCCRSKFDFIKLSTLPISWFLNELTFLSQNGYFSQIVESSLEVWRVKENFPDNPGLQLQRCKCKQDRLKSVNLCGSISTWFSILQPEAFVHRCSSKFTAKHLCHCLFFNEVAGLIPATSLKKKLWRRCFLVNFAKFLRTSFFLEHLRWLLLCNSTKYERTQRHFSQIFTIGSRIVVMRNNSLSE